MNKDKLIDENRRACALPLTWLIVFTAVFIGPSLVCYADDSSKSTRVRDELRFGDLNGKSYTLKASSDKTALVLIFVTADCPIANSYQPMLTRLCKDFQGKGFEFVLVHEGIEQSSTKLKEHATEYSIECAVAMDSKNKIAHRVGATRTPEAFVFSCDGDILYQGRIDDLYQGFGKKRVTATRDDLRIALTEIESGKTVSVPKTEAVGCSIPLNAAADRR